jgi:hypothetical protein
MKVLNAAYRQLLAAAGRQPTGPAPGPSATPAGRRLSREEIDRLVASIGTESWIESVLPRWGLGEGLGFKSSKEWVFTPFVTLTALVWAVIFELCGRRMPEAVATLVLFGLGIAGSIAAYRAYRRRNDG